MLQTCESRLLWRRRKRRHSFEDIRCTKIFYTIALIGCCFLLPHGLTQHNDDVYVVKPTPALRFDKEASQEIHKQFQHFDSGQDASNSDTFFQSDLSAIKNSYHYSNIEYENDNSKQNRNEPSQNYDIDEARYNLATRIMSNGVEVIIASDKTKMPDNIVVADISNSPIQFNKPMTLAASTIKNQMMIFLFPSSSSLTASDDSSLVNQSIQQLSYYLPFHTNHFITKTCLTTYTYRTTYIQDGRTTAESREKVISNIATEERNYPKIIPTQTVGVTLTKTPELAVGIFPTTYSYFNTFKDNSDNLQVMTSEYTVINTITGPNEYVAYLQPTAKATPALKTNTYYNEVTLSHKIKSKMHTVKKNLTQVVITKSYNPAEHSSSVITSYYAYDEDNLKDLSGNLNLLTTSLSFKSKERETENLYDDKTKMLNQDLHIYATKTFLTTFTYYTTTVLSSFLSGNSQTELGIKPMSTVFNYYTRVIENIIMDTVPASLLSSELLSKMKLDLKKQKDNQRHRLIVTTATLKDGQTIKISAMEMYQNHLGPVSFTTPIPASLNTITASQTILESFNILQEDLKDHNLSHDSEDAVEEYGDFQAEHSDNRPLFAKNPERPENNDHIVEDHNGMMSLPSEQFLIVEKVPNNTALNNNIPTTTVLNDHQKPSATSANQLIQRLTALKPMFNAMADLLQNNFGVTRDNTKKPIKNVESKQVSKKKITSSASSYAINSTNATKHPIYIPVQKSPLKKKPFEHTNHTDFIPQSLHIKPPLFLNDEDNFEVNNDKKDKTTIIPFASLISSRQEQPLHNGGIYIRPGEIITTNSDVIIGKPNGIDYVQIPNLLHEGDKNSSSLDNRQFQVTYYHNKVQHPYKKKSPSPLNSNTHKPLQHIPLANNNPTYGLIYSNEKHFNKNILKPPPPPVTSSQHHSHIPIHSHPQQQQGLSLTLTAPDKPTRKRNKHPTATNVHLSGEATSPLTDSTMHRQPSVPPPGGTINFFNLNSELKNNEILEIQQVPQVFSANLKPSLMHNTNSPQTQANMKRKTQLQPQQQLQSQSQISSAHIKTSTEQTAFSWQNPGEPQTLSSYMRLQQPETNIVQSEKDMLPSEYFPQFVENSNWQNVREAQIKTSTSQSSINLDKNLNFVGLPKHQNVASSSLPIQMQKKPIATASQTKLSDMEIFFKNFPSAPNIKYPFKPTPNNGNGNSNQNISYSNDSITKNHQNISLDQYMFSHTVDVNVPPLTFNREDLDYPKQAATAVRGQIPPATFKEIQTPADNAYKYMPRITIPANEQHVQVSLTPLSSISNVPLPHEPQNKPAWSKAAPKNHNANNNNIFRKISPLNDNFETFSLHQQGQDQKTFGTSNILNIKPKSEASSSWKNHRKQQLQSDYNRLNHKSQLLATTAKPNNTVMQQSEEKKLFKLEHLKKNQKVQQQTKESTDSNAISRTTAPQNLTQVPMDTKYPSVRLTQPQSFANEIATIKSHTHTNSEKEHKQDISPTTEQEEISKGQNRLTRVSIPKVEQLVNKLFSTPTKNTAIATVATTPKTTKTTTTATNEPRPEDINNMTNPSATRNIEKPEVSQLVAHGEPFKKTNHNFRAQDNETFISRNNRNKTAAIFIAAGESFKISGTTTTNNNYNSNVKIAINQPEQKSFKKTLSTKRNSFPKEIFVTNETQHPQQHHMEKILSKATAPLDAASTTNTTTTETVLGLHPPPLATSPNVNHTMKIAMLPSYFLSNGKDKSYEITQKLPSNIAKYVTLNSVEKISSEQTRDAYTDAAQKIKVLEKNTMQQHENFKKYNQTTIQNHTKNLENVKSQNYYNLAKYEKLNNSDHAEDENKKPNETFNISTHLRPSESYEGKTLTTTTSPLSDSILIFTTTTTTTIKRIILPTKYITNKRVYTVTTTASAPPPVLSVSSSSNNQHSTGFLSTTETTTEVTTLFLTHTKINTIIDTVTSVKTIDPITITATTTIKPSSTIVGFSTLEPNLPVLSNNKEESIFSSTEPQMLETNHDLTYLPYPSVEVVSTNITQDSGLSRNENSIFIIMTNNNRNTNSNHHKSLSSSEVGTTIRQDGTLANIVGPIDETNEVMIEYDNGISFDDVHIREEDPRQIDNGKSVESSAFVNNVASIKESSSADHVILGGVLIAPHPTKFPAKNIIINETTIKFGCQPKCKASRNEQCGLIESHWSCLCRPGFARMFPDRPCKPTYTYDLLLHTERIGNYPLQYVNELKTNKSEHYKHLSQLVTNALDRMIMQSDFRDVYHGVELTQFAEGHNKHHGILLNVLLQLSDNSNEKRLEEVFKKSLRLSNYSIGGTDLYTNKIGVDTLVIKDFNECLSRKLHDCSENAHCFNLPGTYTCSCVEGFEDISDNSIFPGRICSSEQIGCEICHYHGKCSTLISSFNDRNLCECFPWYAGSKCQVNLKILLIVLLGIGTVLFILLLFCILITCTKRRNHLKHTALAPSTMTTSSEGLPKNSGRLAPNMIITSVGLKSSLRGVSLKTNKRQKVIKIDKRSMIKDSSSETSQSSVPYVLKNKEPITGSCNQKKACLLKNSKKYKNYGTQVNTMDQYSVSIPTISQMENQSDMNTVITTSSSFKKNNQQIEQQNLLGNGNEYEGHYCEQSDRSLTVMIPRAKYHSSVLSQTQLMHHQLTMERVHKTLKSENKLLNGENEAKRKLKNSCFTKTESADEEIHTEIPSNPGALISAGFEVSAIVRDNMAVAHSTEQYNDLVRFGTNPTNYTIITTSDPATSLDSNSDQKHILNEERQQQYTSTSNKKFSTNDSDYNVYKREEDLIETMDEWLGNVKLHELSAEARSFDETTIRASTKPLCVPVAGTQTKQSNDEVNTMAERDLGSTFLLPHTHLYKPERQESDLSGFDSF